MRALASRFDLRTTVQDYGLLTLGSVLLTIKVAVQPPYRSARP